MDEKEMSMREALNLALDQAMARKGIRLIHCITDVKVISNQTTISALRSR